MGIVEAVKEWWQDFHHPLRGGVERPPPWRPFTVTVHSSRGPVELYCPEEYVIVLVGHVDPHTGKSFRWRSDLSDDYREWRDFWELKRLVRDTPEEQRMYGERDL